MAPGNKWLMKNPINYDLDSFLTVNAICLSQFTGCILIKTRITAKVDPNRTAGNKYSKFPSINSCEHDEIMPVNNKQITTRIQIEIFSKYATKLIIVI